MISAVLLHTSGLAVSASSTCETYQAPKLAGQFGCSENASGATIHDTCGSAPLFTSAARMSNSPPVLSMFVPVLALSKSGVPGVAVRYWLKYSSELSPKLPMYASEVNPHTPAASRPLPMSW